ncbi:hypothetical protein [Rugosimonospora africana]|uniref:Uncharacterized protein n=1 Tax=Rugosimonospora africana TaxID=556532 RepID=A0A8J3VUE9_9ACTN|nr:hypothetical protein [Rugosimonospora africana]GIH18894.1 hypothetical protein Raf01_70660 [Rugosimonospora africana]
MGVGEEHEANWGTLQLKTNQYATGVTIDGISQDQYLASLHLALTAIASTTNVRDGDSAATANDGGVYTFFKGAMNPTFPQYLTFNWASPQQVSAVTYVCDWCLKGVRLQINNAKLDFGQYQIDEVEITP